MGLKKVLISIIFVIIVMGWTGSVSAVYFPPLPSSFYGTVTLNGENIPENTLIRALIDGKSITEARSLIYNGESVYTIDIRGDDPETAEKDGGVEGDKITFEVGGVVADQTGIWHGGKNAELVLSLKSEKQLNTPPPTAVPAPTQTEIIPGYKAPTLVGGKETRSESDFLSSAGLVFGGFIFALILVGLAWFIKLRKLK